MFKTLNVSMTVLTKTFTMRNLALASLLVTSSLTNSTISKSTKPSITEITVSNNVDFVNEAYLTVSKANNYLKTNHNLITNDLPVCFPLDIKKFKRISDYFGKRFHPLLRRNKMHKGIDFAGELNSNIYAAGGGTVKAVGYASGYGKYIIINHGKNITTVYGHLNDIFVKKGQKVESSQKIGLLGNTGISTGPHLHFEIKVNKQSIDPTKLLSCNREDLLKKMLTYKKYKKWELQNYFLKIS